MHVYMYLPNKIFFWTEIMFGFHFYMMEIVGMFAVDGPFESQSRG